MMPHGIIFLPKPLLQLSWEEKVFSHRLSQVLNQHLGIWEGATLCWGAALGCGRLLY